MVLGAGISENGQPVLSVWRMAEKRCRRSRRRLSGAFSRVLLRRALRRPRRRSALLSVQGAAQKRGGLSRRCEACFLPSEGAHRQAGMRRRQPKAGAMLEIWFFVRKAAGPFSVCAVCRRPGRCGRPSRPGAPRRAGAGGAALCGFALYAGERGVRFRAGDAAFSGRA